MSICLPWHAFPLYPHCLMYCTCTVIPWKPRLLSVAGLYLTAPTFCVPSDLLIHTSQILLSQQYLAYLVTTVIREERGFPWGAQCCQSSLCTRRKTWNKGANCKLLPQFVGDYGIIIRSKCATWCSAPHSRPGILSRSCWTQSQSAVGV